MSRYFLITIICLLSYCANGQQVVQKIFKLSGQNGLSKFVEIERAEEKYYCIGFNLINTIYSSFILKTDTSLNTLWIKEFVTTSGELTINSTIALSNDSLIINGNYKYNDKNYCWLAKTDSALNIASFRCLSIPNFEYSQAQLCNGDVVVYGTQRFDDSITHRKIFLIAMDTELNIKWKNQIQYLDGNDKIKIAEYPGNGLVVQAQAYITFSTPTVPDLNTFIVRIDSTGNVIWAKRTGTFGPSPSTIPYLYSGDVKVDHQGNIISSFQSTYWSILDFDNVLQKLDPQGNEIACKRFANVSGQDALVDKITIRPDGDILQLMNHNCFIQTDNNFNFISRIWLMTSPNVSILYSNSIFDNNQLLIVGVTQGFDYAIIVLSDSTSNIGCRYIYNINLTNQDVSFLNTDIYADVLLNNLSISDTILSVSLNNTTSLTDSIICQTTTSINPQPEENELTPTITNNYIYLVSGKTVYSIQIFDLTGRIVNRVMSSNIIDITYLKPSIYFVNIYINKNVFKTYKFIKQ